MAPLTGTVGAHKWYLRRPWEAVLCCAFFWTFIPTVLGVMEGVWYLSLSDDAFRSRVVERQPTGDEIRWPRGFTRQADPWERPSGIPGMPPRWDLCAACQTLNPVDARSCLRCGATIPRRQTAAPDLYTGAPCPACTRPTVVGADHCADCGAPLGVDPTPAPAG